METKKNPSKDVHRMRSMFFQIGLGISLIMVITAFEWRTEIKKVSLRVSDDMGAYEVPVIPITNPVDPPPPSPIKREVPPTPSLLTIPVTIVTSSSAADVSDNQPIIDISFEPLGQNGFETDEPEIDNTGFVLFPEKAAEPVGGYATFYKMLGDNLKYPLKAQRNNRDGKVYVEFIVNRDGTPVDIKVFRGIWLWLR